MLRAWIVTSTREFCGFALVERDRAVEVAEAAAHFAEQVPHLKCDFRMAAIDGERASGGGGLRGHVVSLGLPGVELL